MLKPENGPLYKLVQKLFGKGANTDLEKEFLPEGVYHNAQNMRPASVEGHTGSINKIGGEELLYPSDSPNPETYVCIGACTVTGRRVEFWASTVPETNFPIIRINGVTMARAAGIPYVHDRPLQFGDVSRCTGGVIFPADGASPPMFWDIPRIEQAFADGTQEFFAEFSFEANAVGLTFPPLFPVLHRTQGLLNVGTGLPSGQYSYAMRGRTEAGDVSNIGPPTPLIAVPSVLDPAINNAYPGGRTTGGVTDLLSPTPYAIQLEYRVDNTQGYAEIEFIRLRFNDGQGLNGTGTVEIVARIPVEQGQFNNTPYIFQDPRDANVLEIIPPDEAVIQQMNIFAPKAVEYVDNRVVYGNFMTESRIAELVFRTVNGNVAFPVTQRLTTPVDGDEINDGYSNPYHNTYNKAAARGEKYGLGIMLWDAQSGKAPVVPVVDSFQFPNRRDVKEGDSRTYSTDDIDAANVDCQGTEPVTPTFDAFSQGTYTKMGLTTVINVIAQPAVSFGYEPYRPTSPSDGGYGGYDIRPVVGRVTDGENYLSDTGSIWAPRHHALGVAINGIEDIPAWTKAFTVMRTAPAGRVVVQGIGVYRIVNNPVASNLPANKSTNEFIFHSKDIDSGVIPQSVLEDIQNNPQNYAIQCVSPLGFYTEQYGHWNNITLPPFINYAQAVDMLSYAGIQHDEGQVNVGDNVTMGYQPGPTSTSPPGNYVGYSRWRSASNGSYSYWHDGANDGNSTLGIDAFEPVVEGRGTYYRLKLDPFVYAPEGNDTDDSTDFNNASVRLFHQPFYAINIVRIGAEVPDLNSQQYIATGLTVLMESTCGITNTDSVQAFRLLNERFDDVRGWLTTDYRYVYIRTPGVPERAWVCVTNNAVLPVATVLADIAANGFWVAPDGTNVYGIYEAYVAGPTGNLEEGREYVVFGGLGTPVPPANSRVVVKYNNLAPLRTFGFDRTISPSIFAPLDRTFNASGNNNVQEIGSLPLPYKGFLRNGFCIVPDTGSQPNIITTNWNTRSIRQWCILWDAESLTPGRFDLFSSTPNSAFPRQHYKLRPYRDINYSSAAANGFWPQYDTDYPGEAAQFSSGGIPLLSLFNLDYAKGDKITGVGLPEDFDERTDFCNGLIASSRLDPLQQNSPGLRTFSSVNLFLVSEENGEIKCLNALNSGGLQQLYGWTEKGVFKILYNQNILVGADGNTIGTQSVDQFWPRQEIWLSRGQKGMPEQFWRLSVKAHAPTGGGDADSVFWADRVSVYRLTGDSIIDIARNRFLTQLYPALSENPGSYDVPMCSMYNQKHDEFWMATIPDELTRTPVVFVYNARNGEWTGRFTYDFDQYLCDQTTLMGMRDLETFQLDVGHTISGETMEAWAETPYAPFPAMQCELVTFRVAPDKPDRIEIRDRNYALMFHTDEATQEAFAPGTGFLWIKYIDSWEQQVGRRNAIYDPEQKRVQDTLFYKRVICNTAVPFRMTFSQFNTKQIP